MRKYLQLLMLLLSIGVFAQGNENRFNFQIENKNVLEVLNEIEQEAGVTFYLDEKWVLDKNYSGNFTNETLENILETIFKETNLNFFRLNDSKIIITQNNIIYKDLPEGFFGKEEIDSVKENTNYTRISSNPVYSNIEASNKKQVYLMKNLLILFFF